MLPVAAEPKDNPKTVLKRSKSYQDAANYPKGFSVAIFGFLEKKNIHHRYKPLLCQHINAAIFSIRKQMFYI